MADQIKRTRAKVTIAQIMEMIETDENGGFCRACGAEAYGVEPDAREYTCEECGAAKVYGGEELLIMRAG